MVLTKDPDPFFLHRFSCLFGFHAAPDFADRFEAMTLCWQGHGRADKSRPEAFVSVLLPPRGAGQELKSISKWFHALCVNSFPHHRQRYLRNLWLNRKAG